MAVASELERRVHGLLVPLAAAYLEAASGRDHRAERKPEELSLCHEAKEAARKEREGERPRVEVRPVIRGDDVAAVPRDVSDSGRAMAKHRLQHWPAERSNNVVEPARTMRSGHAQEYRRIAAPDPGAKVLRHAEAPRHRRVSCQGKDHR